MTTSIIRIAGIGRTGAFFSLLTTLILTSPAIAAKGGGGKPGDGTEEPPPGPDPAPVRYVLTWAGTGPDDGAPDGSFFHDIDADGVAVGQILPDGVGEDRRGVVSFPDRSEMIDLEALCSSHADYPVGWRLTLANRISDNLLISGYFRDPDGLVHTFATQLVDNGPSASPAVAWFRYFRPTEYGFSSDYAYHFDTSEAGEVLVAVEEGGSHVGSFLWNPRDDSAIGPFATCFTVNNARQMVNRDQLVDGGSGDLTPETLPNTINRSTEGDAWDISEAGTVVGVIRNTKGSYTEALGRIVNGSWQAIGPSISGYLHSVACSVNAEEQILGVTGGRLCFYTDDPAVGFRWVDDLVEGSADDLALWNVAAAIGFTSADRYSLSDAASTGFGMICGFRSVDGINRAFILTPAPAP